MRLKSYLILCLIVVGMLVSSCDKGKQKATVALINVTNVDNQPISSAQVILYGTGSQGTVVVSDTLMTNADGEAIFNLDYIYQPGQAGVAVLDILVTKDGVSSQGIIKVEQEETTREKVIL